MKEVSSFFADAYKEVVNTITKESFENFKNTDDHFTRIKTILPYFTKKVQEAPSPGKNYKVALKLKELGTAHFSKRAIDKAIQFYSQGIVKCPYDKGECRKLLAVVIANRSACLFEQEDYEKALADIEYVITCDSYPEELKYKLYMRQAKCYQCLFKEELAAESYKIALQSLASSKLDPATVSSKKQEIETALVGLTSSTPTSSGNHIKDSKQFKSNPEYNNVSELVAFSNSEELGWFARAAKDIQIGEVIVEEPAYCAVLAEEFALSNCQHCMLATNTPVACQNCANVVFCGLKCQKEASPYHKYECGLHSLLFSSKASVNCLMALRIITQRHPEYFEKISQEEPNKRVLKELEKNHDYFGVYRLCRNEKDRSVEEFVQYTLMALYLLEVLKKSTYFNKENESLEIFIASLMLRHLEALQFNAHEISELQERPPGPMDLPNEATFKAVYIGGGVYPTLAMFNHSCDPSIVRYNINSKVVVRTIKPIKKGEVIYENYGPIYTNMPLEERRKFLKEHYWFTCQCQACSENWHQFKDMVDTEMKIPCNNKGCNKVFYLQSGLEAPALECDGCHKVTNLFPYLKSLSKLENILMQAELLYRNKKYYEASKVFSEALAIYYKNTVPPFPDWVKVQQRLRTCIVSEGNKCVDYYAIKENQKGKE